MKLLEKPYDYSMYPQPAADLYDLRRRDGGRWSMQLTAECWRREFDKLTRELANPPISEALVRRDLKKPGRRPRWQRVPSLFEAPLETQYQRFLLHYRE